ncbi:MAG: GNAT family N-acetyltransferase [Chloroflexi bacterium]|nr:GNAT family N-acetyltransferase [Chloroflexota bacterium]
MSHISRGAILPGASAERIVAAVEVNWRASVSAFGLAPSVSIRDDRELFWFLTGLPDPAFNSIMYANLPVGRIEAAVAELGRLRAAHRVPMNWLVGPASRPLDLPRRLRAQGLAHLTDLTPMTSTLAAPLPEAERVPRLTIERVADSGALTEWIETERQGFESEPAVGAGLARLRQAMGLGPRLPMRYFLGRIDGEPVATASLLLAGGIAGIYDVSTAPDARRRGIGSAMTTAMLQEAAALGYGVAFLQPSEMGERLYRRLGFAVCCVCGVYG